MKSVNISVSAKCISCTNTFKGNADLYQDESDSNSEGSKFFITRSKTGLLEKCIKHHDEKRDDRSVISRLPELIAQIPINYYVSFSSKFLIEHQVYFSEQLGFFTVSTEMRDLYISPSEAIRSLFTKRDEGHSRFFKS